MKIGLVCPYNMFVGGGVQECVLALRDGLIERGHEAKIITPQPNGTDQAFDHDTIFLGTARPLTAYHTRGQVAISIRTEKLESILEYEKFDILHFHEPWVPILSRQIMTRSDAIHFATFHAAMSERRTSRTVERVITPYTKSIFKYIDVMTAVSDTATNYVRTLTERKIEIIPNGIDLKKYKTIADVSQKKQKTILYIGRLEKRKGIKYLLNAFEEISDYNEDYQLLIAGDGPDREKLEMQIEKEEIKNVKFLGYISDKQKQDLLHEADIFCSPALYGESFGIVLLEAMASGCVVVAGNNSGYESVMQGFGQVSLINPKDTKEFARRIKMLATDEVLRGEWKKWAQREVKGYDYKYVVDKYLAEYQMAYDKKHQKKI